MAPWDLQDKPLHWMLVAEAAQDAEHRAQQQAERRANRQKPR